MPKKAVNNNVGQIIRISGPVIDVLFKNSVPEVYEALTVDTGKGRELVLETEFALGNSEVRTLALGPTEGLKRGQTVERTFAPIKVPTGTATLGRIFNVLGDPIDGLGKLAQKDYKLESIHK